MPLILSDDVPPIDQPDEPADPPQVATSPGDKLCQVCGLIIEAQPGRRRGKYHPACRPAGAQASQGPRRTSIDTLVNQISDLYRNIGIGLAFVPTMAMDGMVVADGASKLGESWRPLLEKDVKIRKAWERITTGSGWGTVIMAHAGIGLTIASNHGLKLPGMTVMQPVPPVDPTSNGEVPL